MKIRNSDRISITQQAKLAAEYYLNKGPCPIYVFPMKRTGQSRDFRAMLSARLCEGLTDYTEVSAQRRSYNEARCAHMGYPFIEVDPTDYC